MECGNIQSLWRYPVKSLIGEALDTLEVDARGVVGDRIYGISTHDGKLGSGKDTGRFRKIDGLFSLSAAHNESGVSISFSDGTTLTDKDRTINDKLSEVLGQEVKLTLESKTPHFDNAPIHILTSHCLSTLHKEFPKNKLDECRFRPNIVLNSGLTDDELVGRFIEVGDVTLHVTKPTKRCRMITLAQPGLDHRPDLLNVVSRHFGLHFGVYASVVSSGTLSIGDKVEMSRK